MEEVIYPLHTSDDEINVHGNELTMHSRAKTTSWIKMCLCVLMRMNTLLEPGEERKRERGTGKQGED